LSVTSMAKLVDWHAEMKRKYNPNRSLLETEILTGYCLGTNGTSIREQSDKCPSHSSVVGIDIPYLRHPPMLDAQFMTPEMIKEYLIPLMERVSKQVAEQSWRSHQGFEPYEIERFKRVCMQILHKQKNGSIPDNHTKLNRARFYDFINEMDKRSNTNFVEVFPEMEEFYNICKEERNNIIGSQ